MRTEARRTEGARPARWASRRASVRGAQWLLLLSAVGAGCERESAGQASGASASGGERAVASGKGQPAVRAKAAPGGIPRWRVPVGPVLGVLAGKGLGPIRFGATLATIERHMQAPCTEKVEGAAPGELVCRYGPQAVEFFLREGVLERLWVHGRNRVFSKKDGALYGLFRGGFESGARLGMLPEAVQEYVGKPESVRPAPADHPYGAEEIHTYPGMVLEYNRAPRTGRLVLSGVIVERASDSGAGAASDREGSQVSRSQPSPSHAKPPEGKP